MPLPWIFDVILKEKGVAIKEFFSLLVQWLANLSAKTKVMVSNDIQDNQEYNDFFLS